MNIKKIKVIKGYCLFKNFIFYLFIFFSIEKSLVSIEPSPLKLKMLYNSLDPLSVTQHLAFYDLYPETVEGKKTLKEAYQLLAGRGDKLGSEYSVTHLQSISIDSIVALVNKQKGDCAIELNEKDLIQIEKLASRLPNRLLRGFQSLSEQKIIALPTEEIDLARGLLLSQWGNDKEALLKIRSYEALIDLMALQILARLNSNSSAQDKIRAINQYVFNEMGFRFPPHSTYAKDVDLYTFLPSVLDSRRGVCLGVSILYICLAQRLNLNLEIVTPPGHIFVRWQDEGHEINIETTARGVNIPKEEYLGVDVRSLQERNVKETIGMAHFNQASVYWERKEYDKALKAYIKAEPYLPQDKHLMMFMGFIYLLQGNELEGNGLLRQVIDYIPEEAISKDTTVEDYFKGAANIEGLRAIMMRVDETRTSLLEKKKSLEAILIDTPNFREGLFSLAGTWLQLHRSSEALEILNRYHLIDPNNALVEYYLATLYLERLDYNNAWKHLLNTENLVKLRNHDPKVLKDLRKVLIEHSPE